MTILHEQLLQQQLASQSAKNNYDEIPIHIVGTLDDMAFGISQKEGLDSFEVKQKLVENVNKLSPADLNYLVEQMSILIDKSVNQNETIDDKTVQKDFISFLIRLYY